MTRRLLNLGAGTQSSVLLVMCDRGDVEPVEAALFADTQDEPAEVYAHLDWLERQVKTPIVRIASGDIVAESMEYQRAHKGVGGRYASLPLYTPTSIQRRQCTKYYKIIPILRHIRRNVLGLGIHDPVPAGVSVTHLFGISFDERDRIAEPRARYIRHEYPLVDRRLSRQAVIRKAETWFPGHTFPRSACKRCPYRNDEEWLSLTPAEFAEVCDYDDEMRALDVACGGTGVYVHRSRVPLRQAVLSAGAGLFDGVAANECDGLCSV